jgi:hypothetical protein
MAVGGIVRLIMRINLLTEWRDQVEHLTTKELLDWAREKEFFGNEPFVWDGRGGVDLLKTTFSNVAQSLRNPDELLSHLSRNDAAPLCGDRRRHSGRA